MLLLHVAAYREDPRFVELLIAKGADVSSLDRFGRTPLHLAIALGFEATAAALLRAGSDPNARTAGLYHCDAWDPASGMLRRSSKTPLMIACGLGFDYKLAEDDFEAYRRWRLSCKGQDQGKLPFPQVALVSANMVSLLLIHGAEVNATDENRCTALHWAVMFKAGMGTIEALVKAGADVRAANTKGKTSIDLASGWGKQKTFDYLRSVRGEKLDRTGGLALNNPV